MLNKLKELRKSGSEEGFTLIELMIVVVIIGILAAIAIPIFMNQQKGAIGASLKSDVKNTVTDLNTALVKNPTATDVSTLITPRVSDNATQLTVAGAWDNYTVRAVNDNSDPGCWEYSSVTGKSVECNADAVPGSGDDDEVFPIFPNPNAIVYSTEITQQTLYVPNNGGIGICTGSLSFAFDNEGIAQITHGSGDIRFCDLNNDYNTTELFNGTLGVRIAWAGQGSSSYDVEFPVRNGRVVLHGTVPSSFVDIAEEGATAEHSSLYNPGIKFVSGSINVYSG